MYSNRSYDKSLTYSIIIIIIITFIKVQACFLFLYPQDEVGPSISSAVVLFSFFLLVYIVMLVLVFSLCPSTVRVVATFCGTVLLPFEDFISILLSPGKVTGPLQGESSGGAATLMPLDLHVFL